MNTCDPKEIESYIWMYRSQGINILPALKQHKSPDGFRPPINWNDYQNVFISDKQIKTWIMENKFQNIFGILGRISNNIIEIDVDVPFIELKDIFKEPEKAIKQVWIAESSQGKKKIYVKTKHIGKKKDLQVSNEEYTKTNGKKDFPHVEYRPDAHGSILPPSIHPDGSQYKWLNLDKQGKLQELPSIDSEKLYTKIVDRLRKKFDYKPREQKHKTKDQLQESNNNGKKKLRHCFFETFAHGDRWSGPEGHEFRTAFACELINSNYTDNEIHELFKKHDEQSGEPYDHKKTDYQIQRLRNKDLSRWKCDTLQEKCPSIVMKYCNQCKRYLAKKYHIYQYEKQKDKDTGEERIIKTKVYPINLANLIYHEYDFNFITIKDNETIYRYKNGIYHNDGKQVIRTIAEEYAGILSRRKLKNEIVDHIKDKKYVDRKDFFNVDPNYINLKNGVYDIETKQLLPHNPKYHFLTKIPVNYDPQAECPRFKTFIQEICQHTRKRREDIENTLQEYLGYTLYRSYPFKRYLVLDGSGDNGKTVLMNIVESLIGDENNAGVPLQDLNERTFALSKLYGKLANISDDLPNKALKYSGVIKQITGNSPLWADIKNHKDGIRFINYAKPWNACNQLPETRDITDAFFSRMLQITLLNKYVKDSDNELIDNETVFKADKKLLPKLEQELPGILNFALEGLHRLLNQEKFSFQRSTEEIRTEYIKKTNPVHAFLEDECARTNEDWGILKDDLYNEVLDYCERNGYDKPTSQHQVTTKVNSEAGHIQLKQKTVDGSVKRVWLGIQSLTNSTINQYFGKKSEDEKQGAIF